MYKPNVCINAVIRCNISNITHIKKACQNIYQYKQEALKQRKAAIGKVPTLRQDEEEHFLIGELNL